MLFPALLWNQRLRGGRTIHEVSRAGQVEELLARMTVREKVGQMVMVTNHATGETVPDVEALLRDHAVGSIISFGYHGFGPIQAAERNNWLQQIAAEVGPGVPLLNGGDFEQGLATQMGAGVTDFPSLLGIAASRDGDAAQEVARIIGTEMRAVGFHWQFAPVADVNTNPHNPVIGTRSFGSDPDLVADLVVRQVHGYRDGEVLSCAKHFPGHGATAVDSHRALPTIECDLETLQLLHLQPFAAAFAAGVDSVMTAHILVPLLDPDLPGTLSPRILTDLLRRDMGFQGLVITDLMTMKAISERWPPEEAAVLAVLAGTDVVMADGPTEVQRRTPDGILQAVNRGRISEERLDASVRRVLDAKVRLGLFTDRFVDLAAAVEVCSRADHIALSQRLAPRTVTLVRNDGVLPFGVDSGGTTLVVGVTNGTPFGGRQISYVPVAAAIIRDLVGGTVIPWFSTTEDPTEHEIREVAMLASSADRVIVLTYGRGALARGQAGLVRSLFDRAIPMAVIATGTPFDLSEFPQVPAYVAAYALSFVPVRMDSPRVFEAAVQALFGGPAGGRLPVPIPGLYDIGHGLTF